VSSFARRMPARTLSTMRFLSSSAMAPTMARPSGPPVSMFSRKLTNSIPRWFSSSGTSKKCRTLLATLGRMRVLATAMFPKPF
jgi:hypothetical protein